MNDVFVRLPNLPLEFMQSFFAIKNKEELETSINRHLENKAIKNAIFLAHPVLMKEFYSSEGNREKYYPALLNYLIRMSYRPTPSGMFSSIAKLSIGPRSTFNVPKQVSSKVFLTYSRLYTSQFDNEHLFQDLGTLTFLKNPTLRQVGSEVFIFSLERKTDYLQTEQEKFTLPALSLQLVSFCQRPRSLGEIAKYFKVTDNELEDLKHHLVELLNKNILQHNRIDPTIGGETESRTHSLDDVNIENLYENVSISSLFRGALYKGEMRSDFAEDEISGERLSKIQKILENVFRISPYLDTRLLRSFNELKEKFRAQYKSAAIPLIDLLHFHPFERMRLSRNGFPSELREYLLDLITRAVNDNEGLVEFTEHDISQIEKIMESIPHQEEILCDYSVIISLAEDGSPYEAKLGHASLGSGGLRGKARFSHMFPEMDFSFDCPDPKKIYFDIEFDSKDHTYNMSQRPQSSPYVLRLNHSKFTGEVNWIDLDDVDVTLQGNFFKLYSRSLGKELVPVITTPYLQIYHDHPLYRFLGFVAQDGQKMFFGLGLELSHLPFVPAFTYKKLLLSPRKWSMTKSNLQEIMRSKQKREKMGMPQWVSIRDFDKVLPINLNADFVSSILLRKYKSEDIITIEEEWYLSHGLKIKHEANHYSQEIMFQWINGVTGVSPGVYPKPLPWTSPELNPVSIHVTMPAVLMEHFLINVALPFFEKLRSKKIISGFYFIRFNIPDDHLRFRVFMSKAAKEDTWKLLTKELESYRNEYLIGEIKRLPFEDESETYGGKDGQKIYHEISKILSSRYLPRSKRRNELSGDVDRLPYDVVYLIMFFLKLEKLLHLEIKVDESQLELGIKKAIPLFWKDCRPLFKAESVWRKELEREMEFIEGKITPLIKKIKTNKEFFFRRLIHMEHFRIFGGSFHQIERALPALSGKVKTYVL